MTANQRLVANAFRQNYETASTETLREHARKQLADFLQQVERSNRENRPSPFSRFVDALENEKSPSVGATEQDDEQETGK